MPDIKGLEKIKLGELQELKCPKCESEEIRIRWHTGRFKYCDRPVCGMYDSTQTEGEHIHAYCDSCLYDWTNEISTGQLEEVKI